jgi:glyoxylase-like metal-dependent hydrolase (beta-lactamase superfamily II)
MMILRKLLVGVGVTALTAGVLAAGSLPQAPEAVAAELPTLDAMIEARQLFFGAENVDPDTGAVPVGEVHLSWVSVATFAVAMDGHVLLFDAYIHKEEGEPSYVPAITQDLIDLTPEFIVLGHGHFDHAAESGRIAAATGATIVGAQRHCDEQTEIAGQELSCLVAFDAASDTPGDTVELDLWDGVCTTAMLHVHSDAEPLDPEHDPANTVVPVPAADSVLLHPPGVLQVTAAGDEGGTILYQFRVGSFSLLYHDSSGPLKEQAPQVFDALRALPNTDVELGAILGFNQILNGLRDPAMYAEAIDAQIFVPNHHDFVTEYGSADEFEPILIREFEDYGVDAELRFLYDPFDYGRPSLLQYDIDAPRWVEDGDDVCVRPASGDVGIAAAPPVPEVEVLGRGLAATGGGVVSAGAVLLAGAAALRRRRAPELG